MAWGLKPSVIVTLALGLKSTKSLFTFFIVIIESKRMKSQANLGDNKLILGEKKQRQIG